VRLPQLSSPFRARYDIIETATHLGVLKGLKFNLFGQVEWETVTLNFSAAPFSSGDDRKLSP
jgi:hypothetical protein